LRFEFPPRLRRSSSRVESTRHDAAQPGNVFTAATSTNRIQGGRGWVGTGVEPLSATPLWIRRPSPRARAAASAATQTCERQRGNESDQKAEQCPVKGAALPGGTRAAALSRQRLDRIVESASHVTILRTRWDYSRHLLVGGRPSETGALEKFSAARKGSGRSFGPVRTWPVVSICPGVVGFSIPRAGGMHTDPRTRKQKAWGLRYQHAGDHVVDGAYRWSRFSLRLAVVRARIRQPRNRKETSV